MHKYGKWQTILKWQRITIKEMDSATASHENWNRENFWGRENPSVRAFDNQCVASVCGFTTSPLYIMVRPHQGDKQTFNATCF